MAKSSIMIDLEDPRTSEIAEVISNKTSKSILLVIAEQELTETEISQKLNLPLNTVDYNIKKLERTGLIEKAKTFSWSPKGKAVYRYKASNKQIIISPKSKIKGILQALISTAVAATGIYFFTRQDAPNFAEPTLRVAEKLADSAGSGAGESFMATAPQIAQNTQPLIIPSWVWFILGAALAITIFIIFNQKRKEFQADIA